MENGCCFATDGVKVGATGGGSNGCCGDQMPLESKVCLGEITLLQESTPCTSRIFSAQSKILQERNSYFMFLTSEGKNYLKSIMMFLLHTCCYHKDTTVRKSCVQIFIRLIKDRCTGSQDEEKLVLFGEIVVAQKIMYEKLGDEFLVQFVMKGFQTATAHKI